MNNPQHEHEIEGLPLGRPFRERREGSPKTVKVVDLHRRMQKQIEETENLRYLAYHDTLTGLSNERAFSETFEEAAGEAIARGERIGLALADVDGLKFANDTVGHDAGNQLLVKVAEALKGQSRPQDEVFRIGGDEFAIILLDYGYDDTQRQDELDKVTADRFLNAARGAIEQLGFPLDRVSLSIGVSAVDSNESPRDFFRRVDAILYSHKRRKEGSRLSPIV